MSKRKMLAARDLISEKHYDEARAILKTVKHPVAEEWLQKLDRIAPEKHKTLLQPPYIYYVVGCGALILVALFVLVVLLVQNAGREPALIVLDEDSNLPSEITSSGLLTETFSQSGLTINYPSGWHVEFTNIGITLASPEFAPLLESELPESGLPTGAYGMFISVERDMDVGENPRQVAEERRALLAEGYVTSEGEVLQEPIQSSPVTEIAIGNYSGVIFSYPEQGILVNEIIIDVGNNSLADFLLVFDDSSGLAPLLLEMISTFTFDPALAGDFACPLDRWWDRVEPTVINFLDVAETASQAPRMSLGEIVLQLRETHREFEVMEYLDCASEIRRNVNNGMNNAVDGFNEFLGDSEIMASINLDQATQMFSDAYNALFDAFVFSDVRMSDTAVFIWGGESPVTPDDQANGDGDSGSPDGAVRGFMNAFANLDGEGMASYMCDDMSAETEEMIAVFEMMRALAEESDVEFSIDISGVGYEVVSDDGTNASVRLTGQMTLSTAGETENIPLDQAVGNDSDTLPVVNEGGEWKVCF